MDRAEEALLKSLKLHEELGSKEGIASNYDDLGVIYEARGELDQAQEALLKALDLFEAVGATPRVEQTKISLKALAEKRQQK